MVQIRSRRAVNFLSIVFCLKVFKFKGNFWENEKNELLVPGGKISFSFLQKEFSYKAGFREMKEKDTVGKQVEGRVFEKYRIVMLQKKHTFGKMRFLDYV